MDRFMMSIPEDYTFESPAVSTSTSSASYHAEMSRTRKKETERRHLQEKWERILRDVITVELKMGVASPDGQWMPDMHEYRSTLQYLAERDYHVALDKLHGLV